MKTLTFRFFFFILTFILAVLLTSPALAHGDEPRLEISADRMNPGGVIEVRGVDFEFEELVALALIGPDVEIPLGEITADTEGIFLQIVTLPLDLKEGSYYFRATADDHDILSSALTVQGPAIINEEGGGQGQRDEDDPLLAPMPTFAPGVVPGGVVQPTVQPSSTTTESASSQSPTAIILSALLIVAVLVLFGLRIMRKR